MAGGAPDDRRLPISLEMLHHVVEYDFFLVLDQPMPGVEAHGFEGSLHESRHSRLHVLVYEGFDV